MSLDECTKYKQAETLFTNLQNDIFEIMKAGYGEKIAYRLFEDMGKDDEECSECDEDCKRASEEADKSMEHIREIFGMLIKADELRKASK